MRTSLRGCLFALVWIVFQSTPTLSAVAAGDCEDIADQIRHGGIYWDQNAIFVQGTASPDLSDPNTKISIIKRQARTAATLDAYRKAAEILAGVRISSGVLAGDNPTVMTNINAYVQRARICKAKYYADGGVDMVVKVPLSGLLAKADLPDLGTQEATAPSPYTGIIVDATTVNFAPALIPRLISANGSVLFDSTRVNSEVFYKSSAVRIVTRETDIATNWVGDQPLRSTATGLGTHSPSDIVVDAQTAGLLAAGPAFLAQGRVVILTRPARRTDCLDIDLGDKTAHVDWQQRLVVAKGVGKIDPTLTLDEASRMRRMERAAEVVAQQNLLSTFMGINLDGRKTVKDLRGAQQHMTGILINAIRCDARYFSDGSAEITMAAPIDGMAVRALGFKPSPQALPVKPVQTGYTGLVVDATQIQFQKAMAPSLASVDGNILFKPGQVADSYVMQYGPVAYAESLGEARNNARVGQNPMVIRGINTDRMNPSRILIESNDARSLTAILGQSDFLAQGRVILVVNRETSTPAARPVPSATKPTSPSGIVLPPGSSSQKTHRSSGWSFPGPQKNK